MDKYEWYEWLNKHVPVMIDGEPISKNTLITIANRLASAGATIDTLGYPRRDGGVEDL